jgi:hypothetical protein
VQIETGEHQDKGKQQPAQPVHARWLVSTGLSRQSRPRRRIHQIRPSRLERC